MDKGPGDHSGLCKQGGIVRHALQNEREGRERRHKKKHPSQTQNSSPDKTRLHIATIGGRSLYAKLEKASHDTIHYASNTAHYGDFKSLAASTSFAAAISEEVISLLPSLCELSDEDDDEVKGFFTASLTFSVVVLWSVVSSAELLVEE